MFACHVACDGIGDFVHFLDIAKEVKKKQLIAGYKLFYVITYHPENGKTYVETLKKILSDAGLDQQSSHVHFLPLDPSVGNSGEETFSNYLQKEPLSNQVSNTKAIFSISMASAMSPHFQEPSYGREGVAFRKYFASIGKVPPPCTCIFEHGRMNEFSYYRKESLEPILDKRFFTGFDLGEQGVLLRNPVSKVDKTHELLCIDNKLFLNTLLNYSPQLNSMITQKEADHFLKTTLIVPCYFQEGSAQFLVYMNTIASSPLAAQYKEVVFVMSKTDQTYADKQKYKNLLTERVAQITFSRPVEGKTLHETIPNPTKGKNPLKVRVVEGFWLNNADNNRLYEMGQYFCGCSGDKSFEAALSHGLIPWHQKKWDVVQNFQYYVQALLECEFEKTGNKEKALVAEYLEKMIELMVAVDEKTRIPADNSVMHGKMVMELSALLTPRLFEQWKIVVKDYRKHYNFYDQLPQIIGDTLKLVEDICAKAGVDEQNKKSASQLPSNTDVALQAKLTAAIADLHVAEKQKEKTETGVQSADNHGAEAIIRHTTISSPVTNIENTSTESTHPKPDIGAR
jgi:hypothetical protein